MRCSKGKASPWAAFGLLALLLTPLETAAAAEKRRDLERALSGYRWEPFLPVKRPEVPAVRNAAWVRNPIDAFIAREHERLGLTPRPEAPRHVLLRRLYLDLSGLPPRSADLHSFLLDPSPDAYEKMVDRLLQSPHYGERWGRHWMDVWRYSDWAGWGDQVRDSQPHIWRWRDWIVESLNADRGYDRMLVEMLAADELEPQNRDALRATGYLARSFKLLSREAWMVEAVDHAAQAFLGLTAGCARCHDHKFDPISQKEYYAFRAIFEPYHVRVDRWPGQLDIQKDGLARAFDASLDAKTFLFIRGDDRNPSAPLAPGVPEALGGPPFKLEPVSLPLAAQVPEKAAHVVDDTVRSSEQAVREARSAFEAALLSEAKAVAKAAVKTEKRAAGEAARAPQAARPKAEEDALAATARAELAEMDLPLSEARHAALTATIRVERMEDAGAREKDPEAWAKAASAATSAQRWHRLLETRKTRFVSRLGVEGARAASDAAKKAVEASQEDPKLEEAAKKALAEVGAAEKKLAEAEKALGEAQEAVLLPPSPEYKKRELKSYPSTSTGRRLALARWIAHRENPLAARVAVNHIWLRHFGKAIVPTVSDFGANGQPPSHPALLDWLAAELMEPLSPLTPWSMKALHRLIVTSSTYRMSSTPDAGNASVDPDNRYLWRVDSRRLEAEAVRDAVLHAAGQLDPAMGGPELDQKLVLTTRRRSLYYRHAAEKQSEFLKIFDMAGVTECYERRVSVVPQQALALLNSELTLVQSRLLARELFRRCGPDPEALARLAFEEVLARPPTPAELESSVRFLSEGEALLSGKRERLTSAPPGDPTDGKKPSADPALRARESLVHALMNHHDFVTVR